MSSLLTMFETPTAFLHLLCSSIIFCLTSATRAPALSRPEPSDPEEPEDPDEPEDPEDPEEPEPAVKPSKMAEFQNQLLNN